jgi:hypothetical protein
MRFALLPIVALVAGCPGETVCTGDEVPGAIITVESADGTRICDAQVHCASQTEFEEDLTPTNDTDPEKCTYVGLFDHDGDYDLSVLADEHQAFLEDRSFTVELTADGCHAKTVKKTVTLQPL